MSRLFRDVEGGVLFPQGSVVCIGAFDGLHRGHRVLVRHAVERARALGVPMLLCGGAGGKTDPLALRAGDLSAAVNDALLAKLRNEKQTEKDPLAELTHQEREVFNLIGEGLTNRQIAQRMFLAEKTIKNYVSRILAKLDMQRRTQVAVMATKIRDGKA